MNSPTRATFATKRKYFLTPFSLGVHYPLMFELVVVCPIYSPFPVLDKCPPASPNVLSFHRTCLLADSISSPRSRKHARCGSGRPRTAPFPGACCLVSIGRRVFWGWPLRRGGALGMLWACYGLPRAGSTTGSVAGRSFSRSQAGPPANR